MEFLFECSRIVRRRNEFPAGRTRARNSHTYYRAHKFLCDSG